MSKLLLPLLILCLAGWLFGGAAWFGSHFSLPESPEKWHLKDGDQHFSAPNRIAFSLNSRDLLTNEAQDSMLHEIAEYLAGHPAKYLRLTGIYTEEEINNSERPNLGLARAESVRNLIYRSGVVDLERMEVSHQQVEAHQINPYGLIDGGVHFDFFDAPLADYGPEFKLQKELFFGETSSSRINEDGQLDPYLQALRQYLVDHPQQNINIKAYHQGVSKNDVTQKRVDNMIDLLINTGIGVERINSDFESLGEAASAKNVDGYLELRIY